MTTTSGPCPGCGLRMNRKQRRARMIAILSSLGAATLARIGVRCHDCTGNYVRALTGDTRATIEPDLVSDSIEPQIFDDPEAP